MKVVVFGGSGFVGSHVADALAEQGHEVTLFDLKESPYRQPSQRMVVGDILDQEAVTRVMAKKDVVYHFAGFADLNEAASKPLDTVQQNILGTVTLLNAARQARIRRFVFASTIYVYSDRGGFYRCSKQAAELYLEEYHRSYALPFTILRFGTLYGPRADERNSMWRLLHQGLRQKKIIFSGTGEEIREYIHVRDAARLCSDIMAEEYKNKHIIITGHHSLRVKDVLGMMKEILNNKVNIQYVRKDSDEHYTITPYSYIPKIGKKLITTSYEDMGQAFLECLHEMEKEPTRGHG